MSGMESRVDASGHVRISECSKAGGGATKMNMGWSVNDLHHKVGRVPIEEAGDGSAWRLIHGTVWQH